MNIVDLLGILPYFTSLILSLVTVHIPSELSIEERKTKQLQQVHMDIFLGVLSNNTKDI